MNEILQVQHLSKTFGTNNVLRDIDFTVSAGDVTSIIGASGSGKSTLLRCINLLERPTSGSILFHGEDVTQGKVNEAAYRARVGMVFQSFNLFNNMTVLENCIIGQTKVLKMKKEEAQERAMMFLDKVGMAPYIGAKPRQLSGGQKQRVAIARALAMQPEVLLFDEPTSALDAANREQLLALFEAYRAHAAILLVSHDTVCLRSLCAEIVVMEQGRISERQETSALFAAPQTDWTKRFVQTAQAQEKGGSTWKAWN